MTPTLVVTAVVAFVLGALAAGVAGRRARRGEAKARAEEVASEAAALRRELDDARGQLDELHSSVSHDLRSPIGAALNFLAVLEEDHGAQLGPEARAILARVRRSAQSTLTLLDGLALLARVGRKPLEPRLVDVEALVRSVFGAAKPADRVVELTVAEPLPPVVADPELLRIAFAELIGNAVRFTAAREKARITVGAERRAQDVEYWVADDGVGFDARFAGKLFRVFERLHSREEFPGAGAGLAVVRRIAERHGGRVAAEGELQRGATFRISLPSNAEAAP